MFCRFENLSGEFLVAAATRLRTRAAVLPVRDLAIFGSTRLAVAACSSLEPSRALHAAVGWRGDDLARACLLSAATSLRALAALFPLGNFAIDGAVIFVTVLRICQSRASFATVHSRGSDRAGLGQSAATTRHVATPLRPFAGDTVNRAFCVIAPSGADQGLACVAAVSSGHKNRARFTSLAATTSCRTCCIGIPRRHLAVNRAVVLIAILCCGQHRACFAAKGPSCLNHPRLCDLASATIF